MAGVLRHLLKKNFRISIKNTSTLNRRCTSCGDPQSLLKLSKGTRPMERQKKIEKKGFPSSDSGHKIRVQVIDHINYMNRSIIVPETIKIDVNFFVEKDTFRNSRLTEVVQTQST